MTTDPKPAPQAAEQSDLPGYRTTPAGSVARAALLGTLLAGLAAVLLAALVSGSPAAWGAGVAASMVCLFFTLGAVVLDVATRLAPATSLLVALLTYTLQVVLIGLVFVSLQRSGALAGPVDAQWLGGTVIACTLVWITIQIGFSARARQLAYDLPPHAEEANV